MPPVRWITPLADNLRESLHGLEGQNLLGIPGATLLKERPRRDVHALPLGDRQVVVKRSQSGRKRARTEWDRLVEAHRRGITVPEPIAFGEERGTYWIVQERVASHGDLEVLFRRPPDALRELLARPATRQEIARALGRSLRAWHQAGLEHTDLHAGNLLLAGEPGAWRPVLIDLDGARLVEGPLPENRCRSNLAVLGRFFFRVTPRSMRLRFLRAYLGSEARPEQIAHWARNIERRTYEGARRLWSRRRPWCYRDNRRFTPLRRGDLVGLLDREFGDWGFLDRIETLDEWIESQEVLEVLKDSRSARVVRLPDPSTGRELVVKRSNFRPVKTAGAIFQDSKAMRAWRGAWALRQRQVPIARPLAVLERRRAGLLIESYVVCLAVPNALGLDHDLAERCTDRRGLIHATARLVRDLHVNLGLAHGDLKPANILVSRDDTGAARLVPIDLEGIAREKRANRERRVVDLTRLARPFVHQRNLSRTEFLRFLHIYLGPGRVARKTWKGWWRWIARACSG